MTRSGMGVAATRRRVPRLLAAITALGLVLATAACAPLRGTQPSKDAAGSGPASPAAANLAPYLTSLADLAPGEPERQAAALAAARQSAELEPTDANRLRYALCLGSAGHPGSNPVEASRLITELLAAGHGLAPEEVQLAEGFLREFDARVDLYADNARQREDYEQKLKAASTEENRRLATLNGENQRLKKSLAEDERKLSAVAEMERSLLEGGATPPPDDATPPQ